jgi:hypothetical protein
MGAFRTKWLCGRCEKDHAHEFKARQCCQPEVWPLYVCERCEIAHETRTEAVACCTKYAYTCAATVVGMAKYTAVWQRSECQFSKIIETFNDHEIKIFGEQYECFGCGTNHYAGLGRTPIFTYLIGHGRLELRPIPNNDAERRALLAECGLDRDEHKPKAA